MTLEQLQRLFDSWIDRAMSEPISNDAIAFNFNLAEALHQFEVDVIGAPSYDAENPEWACDEIFAPSQRFFSLPHAVVGTDWQTVQEILCGFVRSYMQRHRSRLSQAEAVTVGFSDGPLERIR